MPAVKKPMRYGHPEGHTEVCFDGSSGLVTCGSDGDIRIWESLDDDPKSINVGEKVYSFALKVHIGYLPNKQVLGLSKLAR